MRQISELNVKIGYTVKLPLVSPGFISLIQRMAHSKPRIVPRLNLINRRLVGLKLTDLCVCCLSEINFVLDLFVAQFP